ncbi:MAG: DUF167 domain-containing protein [Rickettsiales bacterium]|jgi:uncharacterized protein (TIGR00251 family)|nr:DUF167 domain-containing protein [Rickettsiales bacterium]
MIIQVKVIANSKENKIYNNDGVIKIKVREVAEDGKANKAVIELLSKEYKVLKRDIIILKGTKSNHKTIEIKG